MTHSIQINAQGAVPVTFENPALHADKWAKIQEMKAFKDWCAAVDPAITIRSITVQSVDMFGPRVGFLKFKSEAVDKDGDAVAGIVFMRGGAVAILVVISCEDDSNEYTILTTQPRVPTGKHALEELPAGMLDGLGDFVGVAAKELKEETGLVVNAEDLVDMTAQAGGPMYPSAGGCDEAISLFLHKVTMSKAEIDALRGKCTGVIEAGEKIKLKVIETGEITKVRDAKALSAWCLYKELYASNNE